VTFFDSSEYYLMKAEFLFYAGDTMRSRVYFDSVLTVVKPLQDSEAGEFADWSKGVDLAWAYTGTGRHQEALQQATKVLTATKESGHMSRWTSAAISVIRMYLMLGEYERALGLLDQLLAVPNDVISVPLLKIDPRYDPLRDHPRFQALQEYGT
jgi:tetratricopeptide (TPR) repeat protein